MLFVMVGFAEDGQCYNATTYEDVFHSCGRESETMLCYSASKSCS